MRRRVPVIDGIRLAPDFAAIRAEEQVPEAFPAAVRAEAESAARAPRLPDADLTDVPFITLDPPGSMDLDQAMALERRAGLGAASGGGRATGAGYRVRYAIADVAAFVTPGGALDTEAIARGVTVYCPDRRVTLYPTILSEGAASLLPDGPRPAVVWTIDIGADGLTTAIDVRRAMVRSRTRLDYAMNSSNVKKSNIFRYMMPKASYKVSSQDSSMTSPQSPRYMNPEKRKDLHSPLDEAGQKYRVLMLALAERQARGDFAYHDNVSADCSEIIGYDGK